MEKEEQISRNGWANLRNISNREQTARKVREDWTRQFVKRGQSAFDRQYNLRDMSKLGPRERLENFRRTREPLERDDKFYKHWQEREFEKEGHAGRDGFKRFFLQNCFFLRSGAHVRILDNRGSSSSRPEHHARAWDNFTPLAASFLWVFARHDSGTGCLGVSLELLRFWLGLFELLVFEPVASLGRLSSGFRDFCGW